MQTIQVVLDGRLLRAADSAARRKKIDRSALVGGALREHLKRLEQKDNERRDRLGYHRQPDADDLSDWDDAERVERVAKWRKAVGVVARESRAALRDFHPHSRLER